MGSTLLWSLLKRVVKPPRGPLRNDGQSPEKAYWQLMELRLDPTPMAPLTLGMVTMQY